MTIVDEVKNNTVDDNGAPKGKIAKLVTNSEMSQKLMSVEKWDNNDKI